MNVPQLVGRATFHGYRVAVADGRPVLKAARAGCTMPTPLLDALKRHRTRVVAELAACVLCGRSLADPDDRDRVADPLHCREFASPRCPWKAGA